jgi:hypothetical protein
VRNSCVTWDLPDPGSADTDDLSYRGRGTNKNLVRYHEGPRRTISQPGEDGFVLSSRGESVGHSPYYESTGKKVVRYSNSGGVITRDFARNNGVEGLSAYHEDTRLARNSSRVDNSSQRAESRRGIMFLNERTESPYGYGGSDRDTLLPTRLSGVAVPHAFRRCADKYSQQQPFWTHTPSRNCRTTRQLHVPITKPGEASAFFIFTGRRSRSKSRSKSIRNHPLQRRTLTGCIRQGGEDNAARNEVRSHQKVAFLDHA